jgi:hypothetical protein
MDGTRQAVIAKIMEWMDGDGDQPIFWLHGPAGSGKSAIAQTVAEICAEKDRLGASFFFLRGIGHRSNFTRFLPTLAYQLTGVLPSTEAYLRNVLQSDPLISYRSLAYQFQKLMIDPLPKLASPLVIVIDALDECDDKDSIAEFIQVLLAHFGRGDHIPYRIFMTSRVEEHILSELEVSVRHVHPTTYSLALQDYSTDDDIRMYLRSRFATIYQGKARLMPGIRLPWPSGKVLDQLVCQCAGLFIFAATLVDFVNDGDDLPQLKLQKALGMHIGLDPLYSQVFSHAQRGPHFERLIGTVMLLTKPLSIDELGGLLQVETGHVLHALLGIQSVLMVPERNDQPIQLVHTSLRDFLTTLSRSREWYIHPPTRHLRIAIDCLKAILVEPEDGMSYVGFREYASLNWCHHLMRGLKEGGENPVVDSSSGAALVNCLVEFTAGFLDFWVNTIIKERGWLSIMTDLSLALQRLEVSPLPCTVIRKRSDGSLATTIVSQRTVTNCANY